MYLFRLHFAGLIFLRIMPRASGFIRCRFLVGLYSRSFKIRVAHHFCLISQQKPVCIFQDHAANACWKTFTILISIAFPAVSWNAANIRGSSDCKRRFINPVRSPVFENRELARVGIPSRLCFCAVANAARIASAPATPRS